MLGDFRRPAGTMTTWTFMAVLTVSNAVAISVEPRWDAPTEFHHVHPGMLDHRSFPHPQHRRRAAELMRVATASVAYTPTLSSPQVDRSSSSDARGIICEQYLAAVQFCVRHSWTRRQHVQCFSSAHTYFLMRHNFEHVTGPSAFGADPSGKTDSTAAFVAAVKALTGLGGATDPQGHVDLGGAILDLEGGV